MHRMLVTVLLVVALSSSWSNFAVGKENEENFDFKFEENLAKEEDNGLDDRETRLESRDNEKLMRDFDEDDGENTDSDLFFSQDEDEFEKRKSVDYSDWNTDKRFKLNADDTDEAEEKEVEKEEEEAEKGMFKKLFQKFKNWIRKLGKRR